MNCENCCEPIWNFISSKKLAMQIYAYLRVAYGKAIAMKWRKKFIEKIKNKNLCPWCVGFLANLTLKQTAGKYDKFIEKWFIKNWEGL